MAFLHYLPAVFLRKIVIILEVVHYADKDDDVALGCACCFGLVISLVTNAIISRQLSYTSKCKLASRIKIQLNSVIFAKTLTRKDVIGTSSTAERSFRHGISIARISSRKGEPAQEATQTKKLEDGGLSTAVVESEINSSKTQVLNLFSVDCDRVGGFASWSFSLIDAPISKSSRSFKLHAG
ncbi:MAG: hypothetical protein CYPHOPRED_004383 [Cyphobasidiales sp. Tagirdzhanova-0007]|nr:MAG: hypothetical protein CYPHOPRED_004383 [Cyphobasidiales sp. Tagirdzhanova-0007]